MSGVFSPMPVRTLTTGDVITQVADGTIGSQLLSIDASGRVSTKMNDGSGNALSSTTGALDVHLIGGSSLIGSVDQGTSPWVTSDLAGGSVTGGTAGTTSILGGGQFNTSLPTLTTGQQAALQLDSSGRLIVDVGTSVLPTGAATSALQTTGNTSLATIAASILAQASTTSGQTGLLTLAAVTTAAPTYTTGQTDALSMTTAGALRIDGSGATQPVSGTVAVTQTTSPWVTSDLADGSVTGGTAGTKSNLAGGQYNTSLPVLTTGQQAALQTDASSRLLVGSIGSALPAGTNLLGGATVYVGASAASISNPVPVTITSSTPGTLVNKYLASSSVAVAGTSINIYTITALKTFTGRKFTAAGSGKIRIDISTSPDGSTYTTYFTAFTSPSNPTFQMDMDTVILQDSGTGSTIRMIITNEDTESFDCFSTISGVEN